VTIATNPGLVADRFGNCLANRDPDVFNRVVRIDVKITLSMHLEINQTMSRDLIQHVIKKRHTRIQVLTTGAIKV
jgi:hypothetical protein